MGALAAVRSSSAGFGLRFLGEADGRLAERKVPLADAWTTRFEYVRPVREFPSYPGRRGFSGQWWSSTLRDLVGFESWLERDRVMVLDFSPEVVSFSSQPLWLTWRAGTKNRRHAPDYFARLADGTGLVIDVRADDDIEPKDAEDSRRPRKHASPLAGPTSESGPSIRYWPRTCGGCRTTSTPAP
jgi:hypothetical protein